MPFTSLYFAHSSTKHRPRLLPFESEATPQTHTDADGRGPLQLYGQDHSIKHMQESSKVSQNLR